MLKKWLALLLALAMLPLSALAEDSAADMLTRKELTVWAEGFIQRAMKATPHNNPADSLTADGYEFIYDFATLYADAPVMSADTAVQAIVITSDGESGPRGVNVNAALADVLEAYYTENDALLGSRETAVLYAVDNLPEAAMWGQVNRDGQRVQTVQYAVHEQLPAGGEGYSDAGVIYTLEENRVSAVRVYGLNSRISLDAVNDVVYDVLLSALHEDYAQVPFSYKGEELTAFGAEDLTFSGIDFLNLTPDNAALGNMLRDDWMENGDEGWIRVVTYPGCEVTWLYDSTRANARIYMLDITADGLEGPRAVRIGDTFSSVYNRFRNGEGEYQADGTEVLYGREGEGSFGCAEYDNDASATLRYGFTLDDGRQVTLRLTFTVMTLSTVMLYVE